MRSRCTDWTNWVSVADSGPVYVGPSSARAAVANAQKAAKKAAISTHFISYLSSSVLFKRDNIGKRDAIGRCKLVARPPRNLTVSCVTRYSYRSGRRPILCAKQQGGPAVAERDIT